MLSLVWFLCPCQITSSLFLLFLQQCTQNGFVQASWVTRYLVFPCIIIYFQHVVSMTCRVLDVVLSSNRSCILLVIVHVSVLFPCAQSCPSGCYIMSMFTIHTSSRPLVQVSQTRYGSDLWLSILNATLNFCMMHFALSRCDYKSQCCEIFIYAYSSTITRDTVRVYHLVGR